MISCFTKNVTTITHTHRPAEKIANNDESDNDDASAENENMSSNRRKSSRKRDRAGKGRKKTLYAY